MTELIEIRFEPAARTAWVRSGMTLVDAGEAAGVEIVTGCTRGMCGTDPVLVRGGTLSPPLDHELATLDRMGLGPEYRLGCSASVVAGPIIVETGTF